MHDSSVDVGPIIMVLGALTLVGAVITAVALQTPPRNPSNGPSGPSPNGNNPAPYIALGGVGVLGLGMLLTALPPPVRQDGATTQGAPPVASRPPVGGSVTFGF